MSVRIHRSNLIIALRVAIAATERDEWTRGYTADSGYLAGLREVLAALVAGENVWIE